MSQEGASPGRLVSSLPSDAATDCDLESEGGPCGSPVDALAPLRDSGVGRLVRAPGRFMDYVLD